MLKHLKFKLKGKNTNNEIRYFSLKCCVTFILNSLLIFSKRWDVIIRIREITLISINCKLPFVKTRWIVISFQILVSKVFVSICYYSVQGFFFRHILSISLTNTHTYHRKTVQINKKRSRFHLLTCPLFLLKEIDKSYGNLQISSIHFTLFLVPCAQFQH